MQDKEGEFSSDLHQLSQEKIFNVMNFEIVIDKIRSYVSEVWHQFWLRTTSVHIWSHVTFVTCLCFVEVMETCDGGGTTSRSAANSERLLLVGARRTLSCFHRQSQSSLTNTSHSNNWTRWGWVVTTRCRDTVSHVGLSFADVNSAFQQAAHNVFLDDDTLLQKLHFQVPFKDKKDDTPKKSKQQLRVNSPLIIIVCIVSYILRRCSESNESRLECSVTRLLSWLANSNPSNTSCNCKVVA